MNSGHPEPVEAAKKRWLNPKYLAYFIVIGGLIDAINTLIVVGDQFQEENPIMAYLLDIHPLVFFLVKTGVTAFGAWFLYRHRDRNIAFRGLVFCSAVYGLLISYQIFFYIDMF